MCDTEVDVKCRLTAALNVLLKFIVSLQSYSETVIGLGVMCGPALGSGLFKVCIHCILLHAF